LKATRSADEGRPAALVIEPSRGKTPIVGIPLARLEKIFESLGMLSPVSEGSSLGARFALDRTYRSLQDIFKRLATARKINAGKDDPAGLIVSERLSAEITAAQAENRALQRADANANIAEGHARELSSLFGELERLVVASANTGGMSDAEIAANQMQIDNTVASIRRFNGGAQESLGTLNLPDDGNSKVEALYDSALAAAAAVQSGATNDLSSGNFEAAQTALRAASTSIATARGRIGGYQKDVVGPQIRFNLVAIENLTESRSRIADTDFAVEMSNLTRAKVLVAAGIKVLKIAQQQPAAVLNLLS
jgi:flagellin